MRKRYVLGLCLVAGLAVSGLALAGQSAPLRYLPGTDGPLVRVTNPVDGLTWSAWAFRNGAETDIAVSMRDPNGVWSEPQFFGLDDGDDQLEPSLAVCPYGTVYLAYTERRTGRVLLSYLTLGGRIWQEPVPLSDRRERGTAPALRVVGDRLVAAYATPQGTRILELPFVRPGAQPNMTDGPDPVGSVPPPTKDESGDGETRRDPVIMYGGGRR
jgi:hypothetical protein